jgi:hypothetical protein
MILKGLTFVAISAVGSLFITLIFVLLWLLTAWAVSLTQRKSFGDVFIEDTTIPFGVVVMTMVFFMGAFS